MAFENQGFSLMFEAETIGIEHAERTLAFNRLIAVGALRAKIELRALSVEFIPRVRKEIDRADQDQMFAFPIKIGRASCRERV